MTRCRFCQSWCSPISPRVEGGARTYTRPRPPLPRRRPLYRRGRGGAPPAAPRRPPPLPPPPPPLPRRPALPPSPRCPSPAGARPPHPPRRLSRATASAFRRRPPRHAVPPANDRAAEARRDRPRRGGRRPDWARAAPAVCCCLWPCRLVCCRQEGGAAVGWERAVGVAGGQGWGEGGAAWQAGRRWRVGAPPAMCGAPTGVAV